MFPKHNKITAGFVIQEYITLPNGNMVCQKQEFVAGGPVEYEDEKGEPIEVDTSLEMYCPFDMKQPKQIPDIENEVKFKCPNCGDDRIEAVLDGPYTTSILAMYKNGGIEYGDTCSEGYLDGFQCQRCGYTIKDDRSGIAITEDDELVEWIEKNCK